VQLRGHRDHQQAVPPLNQTRRQRLIRPCPECALLSAACTEWYANANLQRPFLLFSLSVTAACERKIARRLFEPGYSNCDHTCSISSSSRQLFISMRSFANKLSFLSGKANGDRRAKYCPFNNFEAVAFLADPIFRSFPFPDLEPAGNASYPIVAVSQMSDDVRNREHIWKLSTLLFQAGITRRVVRLLTCGQTRLSSVYTATQSL